MERGWPATWRVTAHLSLHLCMCDKVQTQSLKNKDFRGTWLAGSMECATLDLGVLSSKPHVGRGTHLIKQTKMP